MTANGPRDGRRPAEPAAEAIPYVRHRSAVSAYSRDETEASTASHAADFESACFAEYVWRAWIGRDSAAAIGADADACDDAADWLAANDYDPSLVDRARLRAVVARRVASLPARRIELEAGLRGFTRRRGRPRRSEEAKQ